MPYIGTVHTYRLRDLPIQAKMFPETGLKFRTINLIRHPIDLVISGFGQFKELFKIDINEYSWTLQKIVNQGLDIVENICDRYNILPGDYDSICFFGASVVLGSLRLDLDAQKIIELDKEGQWDYLGIVRMEDVTSNPDILADLIKRITGARNAVSDAYLEKVYKLNKINVHNKQAGEGLENRWMKLEEWQKETLSMFIKQFELKQEYESFGYDFSFMNK